MKKVNLQHLITLSDLKKGFNKLRKKNKYKDYDSDQFTKRYLKNSDKKENNLKRFIDSFLDLERNVNEKQLSAFYEQIKLYSIKPYNALAIEKGSSNPKKYRPLLVPEPEDRLIFDSLLPIYFKKIESHLAKRNLFGLGLIKKQRVSDILHSIFTNYIQNGYHFALTLDYSSFFSLIDRQILLKKLKNDLQDEKQLDLIDIIINNDIKDGYAVQEKTGVKIMENGIPQGLSFSPLLACYYALDVDDVYLNNKKVAGFRYIDDIIIFGKSEADLIKVYEDIRVKSEELKMVLHPLGTKTQLKDLNIDHVKYLGVKISTKGLEIAEGKFDDLLSVVKDEIFHTKNLLKKDPELIKEVYLNFINGWLNHYEKISDDCASLHIKIDGLLFEKFFSKKRERKAFYKANVWIKISGNRKI